MKIILTLILLFASSIVHSADNDDKWMDYKNYNISEEHFSLLDLEKCKLIKVNEPLSKNEAINDFYGNTWYLNETMDFWYDCTLSEWKEIVRNCNLDSTNWDNKVHRFSDDPNKKNEWEKAYTSCLKENNTTDAGWVLDEKRNIKQCRTGYTLQNKTSKLFCRYR